MRCFNHEKHPIELEKYKKILEKRDVKEGGIWKKREEAEKIF